MSRRQIVYGILGSCCGLVLLLLLFVAWTLNSGMSSGGTLSSGRMVTASSTSWRLSTRNSQDTATIETAGHTIVVAPTTLLVDGNKVGTIDAGVKSVSVKVTGGKITFVADGKIVAAFRK